MTGHDQAPSFKEMERDGWHERAGLYDDYAGRLTTEATARLLDAVGAIPKMRLLDVCCGPGYGAGQAAALGLTAIGIDIAPGMVAEAGHRFPAAEFRVGDAEELEFSDSSFDAVICPFGLRHLPEPDKAISEAFRVLKPGGRYAFTVWCSPDRAQLLGLALNATLAHADMTVPCPQHRRCSNSAIQHLAQRRLSEAGSKMFTSKMCRSPIMVRASKGFLNGMRRSPCVAWQSFVYKLRRSNSAFEMPSLTEHVGIFAVIACQFPALR